jgi:hypothetical protein
VRSMLEGQLETARRDLRLAQHSIARLEGDMAAATDIAASRGTSLNTQVSCLWCPPFHTCTHTCSFRLNSGPCILLQQTLLSKPE